MRAPVRIIASVFVVMSGVLAAAPVRAQVEGMEALGTAPLSGKDAVRARGAALESALRRAVEQAVAQAAPEVRGRFYLVSSRAREFVTTYRVLEEGEAGGQFQLRVSAQIDLPRLLRALQATPAPRPAAARGHLLVCAAEADAAPLLPVVRDGIGGRADLAPAAACPPPGAAIPQEALAGAAGALLVRAPVDLGRTARIRGTTPPVYGAAARAQLELTGAGKSQGRIEEVAEATDFGAAPAEALAAAGRAATERALARVLPQLPALLPPAQGEGVVVAIEGIEGYGQYQLLLRTLAAMPGVAGTEPRRFSRPAATVPAATDGQAYAQAEVLVRTAQPAEPLGAAIGRTPVQGLRLQVKPQDPRHLRLLVVRESALPAAPPAAPTPPTSPSGLPTVPPEATP